MLGALGMLMSSGIKQLENFAGVMNFVIFPMFFASSALYPLWRVQEGSPVLYYVCLFNPFTHAVELIRFALYGKINWVSLAVVCRLHGGLHDRRDIRLRSVARLEPPRARREARHEMGGCALSAARGRRVGRSQLRRRSALSGLALRPGQGAGNLARRGVGWSSARRAATKWKERRQGRRTGAAARRAPHPARRSGEGITEFLSGSRPKKSETGKLLFAGLFDTLNAQRSSVMNGLERITRKQREAAEKIRDDTLALQALQDATPPDQAKVEELGNQLVWETRIFEDRRRVIKFVCEVPTAIDQRLFALGRVIQQEIE